MNYFNYFTEIEDTFVRRRGKHLHLSPIDWALIESWKELGVPLNIALRGIEKSFDAWESKPRKRTIKTLLYCQEEVEAQYAEWLESRVGASSDEVLNETEADDSNPFQRPAVMEHLRQAREQIEATTNRRKVNAADDFSETLQRAAERLSDLEQELAEATRVDAQKLEASLTGIDRMLSESVRLATGADQMEALRKEIGKHLRRYRNHMEPAIYEQTVENLLLKRLREQLGVPRLSLFYL